MDQDLIRRIVEAAIFAAPQPLTLAQLTALFPDEELPPPGSLEQAIADLRADSENRGVELVEVASGFRFQVRADVHAFVARLWTERQTKYTRATLETLALIAYRQPITRGEIEQIRGVSVSANTIKLLEEREWIRVIGHRDVPGRPELFGTTRTFLDYFGLKSLDALPPLAELKDIPELDPQLPFDMNPPGVANAALLAVAPGILPPATLVHPYTSDLTGETLPEADAPDSDDNETDESIVETTTAQSHEEAGDAAEPELRNE
jgi:segregation and condensation protein B